MEAFTILFYDGFCGLCHRAVLFVLRFDRAGVFRFAPLGGAAFSATLGGRTDLPDSLVLVTPGGEVRTRSDAVLGILTRLGRPWTWLARLARLVPGRWLDAVYDTVARLRRRLFARPLHICPAVKPSLRARFLP